MDRQKLDEIAARCSVYLVNYTHQSRRERTRQAIVELHQATSPEPEHPELVAPSLTLGSFLQAFSPATLAQMAGEVDQWKDTNPDAWFAGIQAIATTVDTCFTTAEQAEFEHLLPTTVAPPPATEKQEPVATGRTVQIEVDPVVAAYIRAALLSVAPDQGLSLVPGLPRPEPNDLTASELLQFVEPETVVQILVDAQACRRDDPKGVDRVEAVIGQHVRNGMDPSDRERYSRHKTTDYAHP